MKFKLLLILTVLVLMPREIFAQKYKAASSLTQAEERLYSLQTRRNLAIATTALGGTFCMIGIASGINALSQGQQAIKYDMQNISSKFYSGSTYWLYADTEGSTALITVGLITTSIGVLCLLGNNRKMMKAKVEFSKQLALEVRPNGVALTF